jgi:EpsI family protein
MDTSKRFTIAAAGMMVTAAASALLKPEPKKLQTTDSFDLQLVVPKTFADWSQDTLTHSAMVDPQSKELLDKIYSQILSRTYKNAEGYRIMLSIAYGSDQRGALQAHKPELCYPAQGFSMLTEGDSEIKTPQGAIPVRQLQMVMGQRKEPVTYWFTVGDQAVQTAFDRRIATLKSIMTGRIPDGLLFRVSSIDPQFQTAFQKQSAFVVALLSASSPAARAKLSGLSSAPS